MHAELLQRVQAFARHPLLAQTADLVAKGAAVLALVYLAAGYLALPLLPVFGNDEPHYFTNVRFQLVDDGRWINYLLHGFFLQVPLPIWSLIYLGLFWFACYRICRIATLDLPLAALAASVLVLSTPVLEMSLWPASFTPALLLLCLALAMHARGVRYTNIYLVCGLLSFGTTPTLYFALPLLFLPQFFDVGQPLRARSELFFRHMLWWIVGAIVGVLCMCLMLRLLADIWFPQPGAWRRANPVEDLASLRSNLGMTLDRFRFYLYRVLSLGGVTSTIVYGMLAVALLRVREARARAPAILVLFAVLYAFFAFSVPMGAIILPRSLMAMVMAVIIALALLAGRSAAGRLLAALLLLNFAGHYSMQAQRYLKAHHDETQAFVDRLDELFPGYITPYFALALEGTIDPAYPEAKRFNDPSLMHPIIMALGTREFMDCRIAERCARIGQRSAPISVVPFAGGQLELSVDSANIGIITYRPRDTTVFRP
jgi:hypothetical protein